MSARALPRDLRRALELLAAGHARGWSLPRLAAACATSPRTLQKHFRRFLGTSPGRLLRELRLESVRRELLRAPCGASVSSIATRFGFIHLGRFSALYGERYGEAPSLTLRKRRAAVEARTAAPRLLLPRDRPAVAVLPFAREGPGTDRLSAVCREVEAALSRVRVARITAPQRARYHVHGTLRAECGGAVRASVLVTDAVSGRRLCAGRFVDAPSDAAALDEQVAARMVTAVERLLRDAEVQRACRGEPDRLGAWELSMRALPGALSFERERESRALELLERAMEMAPRDPLPFALASWCHGLLAGHHLAPQPESRRAAARDLAARAESLGSADPLAEVFMAGGFTLAHELGAANLHAERALQLDAGSAWAWGRSGWIRAYAGDPDEAIERFRIARHLAPRDSLAFLWAIGIGSACLESRRYAAALSWYGRALAERPDAVWNDRFRAAAYALLGRTGEARGTLARFRREFPDVTTLGAVRSGLPYTARFLDQVCEGLESAGMRP